MSPSTVNYKEKCSPAARRGRDTFRGPFTNTVRTPSASTVWRMGKVSKLKRPPYKCPLSLGLEDAYVSKLPAACHCHHRNIMRAGGGAAAEDSAVKERMCERLHGYLIDPKLAKMKRAQSPKALKWLQAGGNGSPKSQHLLAPLKTIPERSELCF